jgi:hypothetical protein
MVSSDSLLRTPESVVRTTERKARYITEPQHVLDGSGWETVVGGCALAPAVALPILQ